MVYRIRFKRGDLESHYIIGGESISVENSLIDLLRSVNIDERFFLNTILNLFKNNELVYSSYLKFNCNLNTKLIVFDVEIEREERYGESVIILDCEDNGIGKLIISDYKNIHDILYTTIESKILGNSSFKIKVFKKYNIFLIFNILKNILKKVSEEIEIINDRIAWCIKSDEITARWILENGIIEVTRTKKIL